MDPTKEKAKAEKPKPDKAQAEKPKPDKAQAEKPKPDKAQAEKPKPDKAQAEKPKPDKAKAEKPKPDKAQAEKPKPEKVKAEKPKPEKVKADKSKAEKPKPEKAKAEKAKPDKAKAEKAKPDKAKAEKNKSNKAKIEKPKPKAKAEKRRSDKAKKPQSDKAKADKPKSVKSKSDKSKLDKSQSIKPKTPRVPVNKKRFYKPNPILRSKKKAVKEGRVRKIKENITKIGKIRYGRKKRAIIKKIMKPSIKKMPDARKTVPLSTTKPVGGEKEAGTRTIIVKKPPAYYPTEVPRKKRPAQKKQYPCKLKKSLIPGTVCILLAGAHKGKRVVFLKQLQTGLCLITGPYALNKCPLRRINQIYLIATSTKISLEPEFKVPDRINDEYFRRVKLVSKKHKKEESDIFTSKPKKYGPSNIRKADQKTVDVKVLRAIHKHKESKSLYAYMATKFGLKNHQFPHLLKF